MNSENYRNYYWDNLKGILIIFVLIGHFIQPYAQLGGLWCTIYLFHMPAFVFVTGFFSKRSQL